MAVMASSASADNFNSDVRKALNSHETSQSRSMPMCYSEIDGRGAVIGWAATKQQCETQSTGRSWGHYGHYENIYRGTID